MGPPLDETLCLGFALFRLSQHAKDLRAISALEVFHLHLRCLRRRPVFVGDDCKNLLARSPQRRKSIPQEPLVHLRQLHGADYLGVDCTASLGDSRDRAEILVALHTEIAEAFNHDTISQNLLEVFDAEKQNKPNLQVRDDLIFMLDIQLKFNSLLGVRVNRSTT